MKKVLLAAAFLSLGATCGWIGLARAQGAGPGATVSVPAINLIIGRQAAMDLQSGLLAPMKAAIDSKADVKQFKGYGDALAKWGSAIPGMFVPGTESGNNTKALPAVFKDQAGFAKAAQALHVAGTKLADAAGADDKAAFAAAFQQVGQSCGGCHRNYRGK